MTLEKFGSIDSAQVRSLSSLSSHGLLFTNSKTCRIRLSLIAIQKMPAKSSLITQINNLPRFKLREATIWT
jgi:hypothetical protein